MFETSKTDYSSLKTIAIGAAVLLIFVPIALRRGIAMALIITANAALVVGALALRYQYKRRLTYAGKWLTSQGTVEFVHVVERQGGPRGKRIVFAGELSYSYSVAGAFYSGSAWRCFKTRDEAESVMESCRAKTIQIAYNPHNPELSFFSGFDGDAEPAAQRDALWLPSELFDNYLQNLA